MADIKVKLKNADGNILLPASLSDILGHGYGESANFNETTVKAELDKLLKLMTSSGATLDDAISALEALNTKSESTHYSSLVDLATFIENFMIDEGVAEGIIDTWEELEKFLQGITEADSLTGLLQLMYNRVNAEKSIVEGSDNIKVESGNVTTTYKDENGDDVETTYTKYTISAEGLATTDDIAGIQGAVETAQTAANEAAESAANAQTAADAAEKTAEAAQDTANTAQTAATNAQAAAEAALDTANSAVAAASDAQSTADTAADAAAKAQKAAESAQSDIDALSESLDNYALKTDIPTKVSKLENDSGYITEEALDDYAKKGAVESAQADATQALADAASAQVAAEQAQSDVDALATTVEGKQDKLTEGNNIVIEDNTISATGLATKEELESVSIAANSALDQASTNANAITVIQESITSLTETGVYYVPIND